MLEKVLNSHNQPYSEEILENLPASERIRLAVRLYGEKEAELAEAIRISGLNAEIFADILRSKNLSIRSLNILIAGGAGFIGSNFVRHMVKTYPHYRIINYDKLTYAGNLENLKDIEAAPNYKFYQGDIADPVKLEEVITSEKIDAIVNFAAETHVDRSIHIGPRDFVLTNVLGTQVLLDAARRHNLWRMIQISTDEVYGSLPLDSMEKFTETTPMSPNSPYSAAKAGGDNLCRAYYQTFGLPVIITHCSNNYGPYEFPEKLIPFFISRCLSFLPLPLYGDGKNVRDWLYVQDHVEAVDAVLHRGTPGETYNIGGGVEKSNLAIAKIILGYFRLPDSYIQFVADRPGHDRRYAIEGSKIERELGWKARFDFETAISGTISWYVNNPVWVEKLKKRHKDINSHIRIQNQEARSTNQGSLSRFAGEGQGEGNS